MWWWGSAGGVGVSLVAGYGPATATLLRAQLGTIFLPDLRLLPKKLQNMSKLRLSVLAQQRLTPSHTSTQS